MAPKIEPNNQPEQGKFRCYIHTFVLLLLLPSFFPSYSQFILANTVTVTYNYLIFLFLFFS